MTTNECTAYIKNYFNNKTKSGSALMLTSSWGSGKSYYIDNELIKAIGRENCVKVSLYGLKSLDDISKAIYLEMRTPQWSRKNEVGRKVALFGRTVLRGIFSYFKLNLTPQETELQEIYNSVNLENKLVILEDVERSGIPMVDIMGYVNNLCEQDQVKVLLVINEEEINEGVEETKAYYRIKEKTVSDTIIFSCPIKTPIENILKEFSTVGSNVCGYFASIKVEEISSIMQDDVRGHELNGYNFRSLIFACQKTQDLFELVKDNKIEFSSEFFSDCLYSIIAFSLKFKRGEDQDNQCSVWTSDMDSPGMLGHIKYPLLKDCYDFIVTQKFNSKLFAKTINEYPIIKQKDANWRKLNAYDRYPFQDLVMALDGIKSIILQEEFPLADLGTLISKLYSIKAALKDDIAEKVDELLSCIKNQLEHATFSPSSLYDKIVTATFPTGGLADLKQEYEDYKLEISEIIIKKATDKLIALTKSVEVIEQFRQTVDDYENASYDFFNSIRPKFTSRLEIKELVDNLAICRPNIVADFADGFCRLYIKRKCSSDESGESGVHQVENFSRMVDDFLEKDYEKDGSYLSSDDKEIISKIKDVIERKYGNANTSKIYLSNGVINSICELISCLEEKIKDSDIDKITKLQLKGFIRELRKIYN